MNIIERMYVRLKIPTFNFFLNNKNRFNHSVRTNIYIFTFPLSLYLMKNYTFLLPFEY